MKPAACLAAAILLVAAKPPEQEPQGGNEFEVQRVELTALAEDEAACRARLGGTL